jgi:hypothetical protein
MVFSSARTLVLSRSRRNFYFYFYFFPSAQTLVASVRTPECVRTDAGPIRADAEK